MKFYTKPIVRYCYRYIFLLLFIVLPVYLSSCTEFLTDEDTWIYTTFCLVLAVCGILLVHFVFWEKFFAILIISEDQICWKCPFRKQRIIPIVQCVEIGVYIENEGHGIPSKQIYFSDYPNPCSDASRYCEAKKSGHLVSFWYSEDLCNYLFSIFPPDKTSQLF